MQSLAGIPHDRTASRHDPRDRYSLLHGDRFFDLEGLTGVVISRVLIRLLLFSCLEMKMSRSFYSCDRDQMLLLPPSIGEWVPEDDLARFVVEVVEQMDLKPFYARYKDGTGQTAYRPEVLLGILILGYCIGIRSSRVLERLCIHDIRFRFVTANEFPHFSTISRFRKESRDQFKELFVDVLRLCNQAGLLKIGNVALDGTAMKADASMRCNRTRKELGEKVEQMLLEAEQCDEAEDAQVGADKRGDELPDALKSVASRRAKLRAAKQELDRIERAYAKADAQARSRIKEYDERVAARQAQELETGKKIAGVRPQLPKHLDEIKANTTDPDSNVVKSGTGYVQGYNAQAAVETESQIIVAAEIATEQNDVHQLPPMIQKLQSTLERVAPESLPKALLTDAGYWTPVSLERAHQMLEQIEPAKRPELICAVPPRYQQLKTAPQDDSPASESANLLYRLEQRQRSPGGQRLYQQRGRSIEPVFGQIKANRKCRSFMMRLIENVRGEWDLICMTHNMLKLFRHSRN